MKTSKIRYRPNAPGGTRRRATTASERGFLASACRTLVRDARRPWQKKGGNEEDNSGMRGLRRLPGSIAEGGGVD
jgi:hypothetical protein